MARRQAGQARRRVRRRERKEHERDPFSALVDFLWRERKVIAEADGLVKYHDRKDLLNERERDHQLRQAGYVVVHFTWKEIFQTPEAVVARIRTALAGPQ